MLFSIGRGVSDHKGDEGGGVFWGRVWGSINDMGNFECLLDCVALELNMNMLRHTCNTIAAITLLCITQ